MEAFVQVRESMCLYLILFIGHGLGKEQKLLLERICLLVMCSPNKHGYRLGFLWTQE